MTASSDQIGHAAPSATRFAAGYAAVALMNGFQLVTLDTEVLERAGPELDACGPGEWLAREPRA